MRAQGLSSAFQASKLAPKMLRIFLDHAKIEKKLMVPLNFDALIAQTKHELGSSVQRNTTHRHYYTLEGLSGPYKTTAGV
jgi:hypothetical protein